MKTDKNLSRRKFMIGLSSLSGIAVSGCISDNSQSIAPLPAKSFISEHYALMYGPRLNEPFPIPAIDLMKVAPRFYRQQVDYTTSETIGTIIIDTKTFYLYLVQENGKAMRYGVGLGRAGFSWAGRAYVAWKRPWPTWTPPADMIERQPDLARWSAENGGMPPGLNNPLGARALYIFQNGVDTLYRIHGSPEYWTIGKAVSSGCVRMMNQDVIDLYERIPKQSPIIVF